jgi:hypothetical protein
MDDWIDVAWSFILEQAPLMSDPVRWRKAMHDALWLGKEPELTAEERRAAAKHEADEARKAIGTPVGAGSLEEMKALMQRASDLRGNTS